MFQDLNKVNIIILHHWNITGVTFSLFLIWLPSIFNNWPPIFMIFCLNCSKNYSNLCFTNNSNTFLNFFFLKSMLVNISYFKFNIMIDHYIAINDIWKIFTLLFFICFFAWPKQELIVIFCPFYFNYRWIFTFIIRGFSWALVSMTNISFRFHHIISCECWSRQLHFITKIVFKFCKLLICQCYSSPYSCFEMFGPSFR